MALVVLDLLTMLCMWFRSFDQSQGICSLRLQESWSLWLWSARAIDFIVSSRCICMYPRAISCRPLFFKIFFKIIIIIIIIFGNSRDGRQGRWACIDHLFILLFLSL